MKEELRVETWDMEDFSVQASIAPEILYQDCDVVEVKRDGVSVMAVVPWDVFMALLRDLTLSMKQED